MVKHTQKLSSALLLVSLSTFMLFLATCTTGPTPTPPPSHRSLPTDSGIPVTYSILPQDVLVRVFYGGGKLGTLELMPEVSIYGDGAFILGPSLHLQKGSLTSDALQQLLRTLVNTDSLLSLHRQQFYDMPDQNATLLQLTLNGQYHEFLYGPFGNLTESAQDMADYHHLGDAIATVRNTLQGPFSAYTSGNVALLVHETFSPDLTQNIPTWPISNFSLFNAAAYECGVIPPDQTGPNADNGCLTFTVPHTAILPTRNELQTLSALLHGQDQATFIEQNLYYTVVLRPLLPDEIAQNKLAMYGSNNLDYAAVPLKTGPIPVATPAQ